jgi:hypothetical protein
MLVRSVIAGSASSHQVFCSLVNFFRRESETSEHKVERSLSSGRTKDRVRKSHPTIKPQPPALARAHWHVRMHPLAHARTRTGALARTRSHTHALMCMHPCARTRALSHTPRRTCAPAPTYPQLHAHACTNTCTRARTHARTLTCITRHPLLRRCQLGARQLELPPPTARRRPPSPASRLPPRGSSVSAAGRGGGMGEAVGRGMAAVGGPAGRANAGGAEERAGSGPVAAAEACATPLWDGLPQLMAAVHVTARDAGSSG